MKTVKANVASPKSLITFVAGTSQTQQQHQQQQQQQHRQQLGGNAAAAAVAVRAFRFRLHDVRDRAGFGTDSDVGVAEATGDVRESLPRRAGGKTIKTLLSVVEAMAKIS